jgi:RimJ/RimL family protein N-acetyltransferase
MAMQEIAVGEVTLAMLALLAEDVPVGVRRTAVLMGKLPGKILTDDPRQPSWVVIWEAGDGTVYWGGALTAEILAVVVARLRQEHEVLIPFWTRADPIVVILPPEAVFEGAAIDFLARDTSVKLDLFVAQLPDDLAICPVTPELFEFSLWYEENLQRSGSAEAFLAEERAYYLMKEGAVICEASAGPLIDEVRELGVVTHEKQWGLGYATLMCAYLIREMEAVGERSFWNCSTRNLASAAVARKLGFVDEKVFEFVWYERLKTRDWRV